MLKHLPVDIIKIDRAFVRGLPAAQSDAAIARAILALAQSISTETRAEGVETAEQAAWLHGAGCNTAQGFWIARPLGPMSLLAWIQERTQS
jgi:EAL domain-containing protein (putative c-di-GMP-specific phosphodiesterase class I)